MSFSEVDAGTDVQRRQVVVGLEGAVVVGRLRPRDVHRRRDVARSLRLLLRQVRRREQASGVLVGRADVDEVLHADGAEDLVAERADRGVLLLRGVLRRRTLGDVGRQLAGVELPLLAAAVEQLHRRRGRRA